MGTGPMRVEQVITSTGQRRNGIHTRSDRGSPAAWDVETGNSNRNHEHNNSLKKE